MIVYIIIILIISTGINWIVSALNNAGFKTFWKALCCTGIPVHETSHFLFNKLFGVKVVEFKPLIITKKEGNETIHGHVMRGGPAPHVMAQFVISFGPTLVALPLSMFIVQVLFALTIPPMSDLKIVGTIILGIFLLGVFIACSPSGTDLSNFLRFSWHHKLQFLCFIVGCIIGYYLSEVLFILSIDPLGIIIKMFLFFLPAWILNKLAAYFQNIKSN
ncbi:MAG: hypothetical protein ACFFCS_12240 [Candidatus Hodarchaeota archaeon]